MQEGKLSGPYSRIHQELLRAFWITLPWLLVLLLLTPPGVVASAYVVVVPELVSAWTMKWYGTISRIIATLSHDDGTVVPWTNATLSVPIYAGPSFQFDVESLFVQV